MQCKDETSHDYNLSHIGMIIHGDPDGYRNHSDKSRQVMTRKK